MSVLPVQRASEVTASPPEKWLVESLWTHEAVGFVAGQPKSGKSWLALDFAVSVATGTPVLDNYAVTDPGPVLVFPAEEALTAVRDRVAGICRHRSVDFETLNVWFIGSYALRLDSPDDCEALENTVCTLRPRLLILDPLIRLHNADENSSTEIARVLSFLRDLQRKYALAVLVVHHARKNTSSDVGLGLRGSTEIRAWSDTNLYIRRNKHLEMIVEHRAAPCPEPVKLDLTADDDTTVYLAITDAPTPKPDLKKRILEILARYDTPLSRSFIRSKVGIRNQTVGVALQALVDELAIEKITEGYVLRNGTDRKM